MGGSADFLASVFNYAMSRRADDKGSILHLSVKSDTREIPPNCAPYENVYVPSTEENNKLLDNLSNAIATNKKVMLYGRYDYTPPTIMDHIFTRFEGVVLGNRRDAPADRRYQCVIEIDGKPVYGVNYRTHKKVQAFEITHIFQKELSSRIL